MENNSKVIYIDKNNEFQKPRLIVIEEIVNDINSNIIEMDKYCNELNMNNKKANLIYIYTLFEGALWQLTKSILTAFPEKANLIDIELNKKNADLCLKCINDNYDLIDELVKIKLEKVSKGNLVDYLNEILKIIDIDLFFDKNKLIEISRLRNEIVHNNTLKTFNNENRTPIPEHQNVKFELFENVSNFLLELLKDIKELINSKYKDYNLLKLMRASWYYTIGATCIGFENIISFENSSENYKGSVILNFENIKRAFSMFSSGEKTMLAFWLQQYSGGINDKYIKFNDINMLVSLSSNEKIIYFIKLFERFPYLMNGQNIIGK